MSTLTLTDKGGKLYLRSTGVDLHRIVDFTTSLGKWSKARNAWTFPALNCCVQDILQEFPETEIRSTIVEEILSEPNGFESHSAAMDVWARQADVIAAEFYNTLYDFQKDAVHYLYMHPYKNALLGLSPGLGKTATALVTAQILGLDNIVVVCPKILIPTWEKEIKKWSDYTFFNAWQKEPDWDFDVNIVNYESLHKYSDVYRLYKPQLTIIDESILVKSMRGGVATKPNKEKTKAKKRKNVSRRALHALYISAASERVWLLSGAPAAKDASDLFGQFRIMYPKVFTSFWKFAERHCIIEKSIWSTHGDYGGNILGTKHDINLRERFVDLMFMRNMEEVAAFLPDYITVDMPLQMEDTQKRLYVQALQHVLEIYPWDGIHAELNEMASDEHRAAELQTIFTKLEEMIRLQQIVSNPISYGGKNVSIKHDAIVEIIRDGMYETPMLIWSFWKKGAEALALRLKKECPDIRTEVVNGDTKNPSDFLQAYEDGEIDVLILSLAMGKYGLTLTNTKTILAMDRYWDGDMMYQSSFRTRRLNLKHSPVWVNLYIPDTIDEYVMRNIATKFATVASVTGANLQKMLGLIGGKYD